MGWPFWQFARLDKRKAQIIADLALRTWMLIKVCLVGMARCDGLGYGIAGFGPESLLFPGAWKKTLRSG